MSKINHFESQQTLNSQICVYIDKEDNVWTSGSQCLHIRTHLCRIYFYKHAIHLSSPTELSVVSFAVTSKYFIDQQYVDKVMYLIYKYILSVMVSLILYLCNTLFSIKSSGSFAIPSVHDEMYNDFHGSGLSRRCRGCYSSRRQR